MVTSTQRQSYTLAIHFFLLILPRNSEQLNTMVIILHQLAFAKVNYCLGVSKCSIE